MQALTHTQTSTVKQSSQHGASCMHACVYEVWHCVFWSIRRFVFAIIPCQQHLGRQTIAEKIGSQTPFTLSLAGQCASSRLRTHTGKHTHTRTIHVHPCSHTHTENTHVPLRCTLLTPSPGSLQRVVVQFSRTRLSEIPSLSLLSLWHTLSVSLTLICFSVAGRCHNRCKCAAAFLLSPLFIPFPSIPFSLLSSLALQLRGRFSMP